MEAILRIYTHYFIYYDIEMTQYANEIKISADNPKIGHVHKPNSEATLMGVNVNINSDGLRDKEYPVERGQKYRIIFLGDSITFGWGVEKEDTFETLLEVKLNEIKPTEVLNFGTGNYNSEQEVNLFFKKGQKYKPAHIVLFYFINDAEITPQKSKWEFLSHSRVITFFWSRIQGLMANLSESKSFKSYYSGLYSDDQQGWINTKKALTQMAQYSRANQIRFDVILLPELHNLNDYPLKAEHAKIITFLNENNINGIDLVPFFSSVEDPQELWVAADDAHPNKKAHQMIADFSFDFITRGIKWEKN
ncbi:MAG: hypothetical protein GWN00_28775 [Aliifodinibius sp.]|nr:SGNH/GDSL hydrolase family protein [Fodinibius sp.]NIY28651.1 hypothetical protein [Fodinibius sp.]